ncbi:MAG: hypothetical protein KDE55_21825, partial [Novosphingobium sp.]|nr:hypothetical protein [Novosphingobium sp.]
MAESATPESEKENLSYRIRRDAGGAFGWLRATWREKRLVRWLTYALLAFFVVLAIGWTVMVRNLPSAEKLLDYQPPLPTM